MKRQLPQNNQYRKEVFSLGAIFFVIAAILFAIAGLNPFAHWDLGRFDPVAWGLCALALGHLIGGSIGSFGGFGRRRDVV